MLIVGRRAIPWLLHVVAHGGSPELFRLAVLATALGVAFGAAMLFGSIMLNPLLFGLADRIGGRALPGDDHAIGGAPRMRQGGHVVLVGHGRVGSRVSAELLAAGEQVTIIETHGNVERPLDDKATFLIGNAASEDMLHRARMAEARLLFVAIPESCEAGRIVEQARAINPSVRIVARTHEEADARHLVAKGRI